MASVEISAKPDFVANLNYTKYAQFVIRLICRPCSAKLLAFIFEVKCLFLVTTENLTVMPAISYAAKLSLYVQKSRVNPFSFSQPYFDMKMGKHKNIYGIVVYKKNRVSTSLKVSVWQEHFQYSLNLLRQTFLFLQSSEIVLNAGIGSIFCSQSRRSHTASLMPHFFLSRYASTALTVCLGSLSC